MINVHHTADGEKMLIAEMSDQHLINTIGSALNKIERSMPAKQNTMLTEYQKQLYGVPEYDAKELAKQHKRIYSWLFEYIAELWLRDIDHADVNTLRTRLRLLLCRYDGLPLQAVTQLRIDDGKEVPF